MSATVGSDPLERDADFAVKLFDNPGVAPKGFIGAFDRSLANARAAWSRRAKSARTAPASIKRPAPG